MIDRMVIYNPFIFCCIVLLCYFILLENILLWNEIQPDGSEVGIALSFQDAAGCHQVW